MLQNQGLLLVRFLSKLLITSQFVHAVEFTFNSLNTSDLLLYGDATIKSGSLSLTKTSTFSIGRSLYHAKMPTRSPKSSTLLNFSTSFTFSVTPFKNFLPDHGFVFVFVFVPSTGLQGASPSRHLGFVNRTDDGNPDDHLFGIGFDAFQNPQFNDINDNHVGVDVNCIASVVAHRAGYWLDKTNAPFKEVKLNSGDKYNNVPLVSIEYLNSNLSISLARANEKKKPHRALIKVPLDLSGVFVDEMYVGFTASTGQLLESLKILNWTLQQFNKYGLILMFWFFLERDVRIVVLIK